MRSQILFHWGLFMLVFTSVFSQNQQVDSLKVLVNEEKKDTITVNQLLEISTLLNKSNPDSAQEYAQKAIQMATDINFKKGVAYGYKNLGLPLYFKGEFNNILIGYWQESLSIFEEIGDKQGISNLQSNLGSIYQTKGDDPTALEFFLNSVRIAEEINDSLRIATAYLNIGSVYSNQDATRDQALEAYQKAKRMFDALDYHEGVGYAAINMAELYLENNPKSALIVLNESIGALNKAKSNIATSLIMMGQAYRDLGNFELSKQYYQRAINTAKEKASKMEESKAYIGLGNLFELQNQLLQATDNYHKALDLTETTLVNRDKRDIYDGLAQVYSKLGNFESAYEYQKLFSAIRDTIRNSDYDKTLGNLRFQFDIEKKEQEIDLLNAENELKQAELQRATVSKRYFIAIGGLFLAIIMGFIFQYRFVKKSNKQLAIERNKSEKILLNILPKEMANELKNNGVVKAKEFEQITVLFTDFKAFSVIAEKIKAEDLVKSVDYYFSKFDEITEKHGLEKIKTIGDSYMCAGGLPTENTTHAEDALKAAKEILEFVKETEKNPPVGIHPFEIRLGINTGSVVAGVVGTKKFQYDIWGNSVNIAARMESNSLPGRINVSENTYQLLKHKASFTYRGIIKAKNEQNLKMYFVEEVEESVS